MDTCLINALHSGKFKLANILIQGGHNVNICNSKGATPLMLASKLKVDIEDMPKKIELMEALLNHHATLASVDRNGRTALMYALHSECTEAIQLLKSHGLFNTVSSQTKFERTRSEELTFFSSFESDE
ncbi:ankyrin repeat domain-containing protein 34B-like [Mytilus edulis]|uniref:ankyrin repeat domain-containing protein 34B-like n=1 Tax=Mytilus edulis TaxID=6550 RepID=UPI0039EE3852